MEYTYKNGIWGEHEIQRITETTPKKKKQEDYDKNIDVFFEKPIPIMALQRDKETNFGSVKATLRNKGDIKGMAIDINNYMFFAQDSWDVYNFRKHYTLENASIDSEFISVDNEENDDIQDVEIYEIDKVFNSLDLLYNICYSKLKRNIKLIDALTKGRYESNIYFACYGLKFLLSDRENRLKVKIIIDPSNKNIQFSSSLDYAILNSYDMPFNYSGKYKRTLNKSFRDLMITLFKYEHSML